MTILKNIKENRGRVTLASVLITSLMLASLGLYVFVSEAKASALTGTKLVLSTSTPSVVADNTLFFTATNGLASGETIILTYNFDGTAIPALDFNDIDLSYDTTPDATCDAGGGDTEMALAAAPVTTTMGVTRDSTTVLTFTNGITAITAGSEVCIEVGLHAETGGAANQQITNASKQAAGVGVANVKSVEITGTIGSDDTGTALVAIIEGIAVSVTIDESLSFSIVGVTAGDCDTEFGTLDGPATVTANAAVPFATVTTETFYHACHDLTISTNASGGYTITGEESTSLLRTGADSNDKTINDTPGDNGTATETTQDTWATATFNGFGYSCEDSGGAQGDCAITASTGYKQFACIGTDAQCDISSGAETKQTVASNVGPVSSKISTVEYKLSVDGAQPAGTYSNTVTYIATPTF